MGDPVGELVGYSVGFHVPRMPSGNGDDVVGCEVGCPVGIAEG